MYVEEFVSPVRWDSELADLITFRAAGYSSRIMFTCNGNTVHAPVLPVAWDGLAIAAGSTVLVTADGGRGAAEDARAVADVVDYIVGLGRSSAIEPARSASAR